MAILRSCCCWQTAYASGLYTLIYFVISSISILSLLKKERAYIIDEQSVSKLKSTEGIAARTNICPTAIVVFNVMMLALASIGVIASVALLIGIFKNRRQMLFPWISVMTIDIFVEFSHFIYVLIFEKVDQKMATMLIFFVDFFFIILHIWCLLCVVSQCQQSSTPHANDAHIIPFSQASKNCPADKDRDINCAMKNMKIQNDLKYIEDIMPYSEHQEYFENC